MGSPGLPVCFLFLKMNGFRRYHRQNQDVERRGAIAKEMHCFWACCGLGRGRCDELFKSKQVLTDAGDRDLLKRNSFFAFQMAAAHLMQSLRFQKGKKVWNIFSLPLSLSIHTIFFLSCCHMKVISHSINPPVSHSFFPNLSPAHAVNGFV